MRQKQIDDTEDATMTPVDMRPAAARAMMMALNVTLMMVSSMPGAMVMSIS